MALDETDYIIIKEIKEAIEEQNKLINTQNTILATLVEQLRYLR